MVGSPKRISTGRVVAVFTVVVVFASLLGFSGGVDAGISPLPEGTGSIAGTVTGPGGEPVEGVSVYLSGGGFVAVETGSDGAYVIPDLAAGYYAVAFQPPAGSTLAAEYYDDSYTTPTPVQVVDDEITPGIDAQLAEGSTLSGTVTDPAGDPVADVVVFIESWGLGGGPGSADVLTASDGTYTASGLPPGYYRIYVAPDFDSPLVPQYYDGAFVYYQATPVLVTPPAPVADIDVQLTLGGSISGTVIDAAGDPLVGVEVYAEGSDFGFDTTAPDGTYEIVGLRPGEYRVSFQPGSGLLAEYYDNVTDYVEATPIPVDAGQAVTGIDAVLEPGASITGQVIGLDGLPDSNVPVWVTTPSGGFLGSAITNFNGEYFINDLPAGDAIVEFRPPFNTQYYDRVYRRADATPVDLAGGLETTDIDAVFEAIMLGTQFATNTTLVETYCFDDDDLTFTFDVTDLDTAGGVTGGSVDFGDGSPPWVFDSAGDTTEHTFPDPSALPTPPAYEVTLTLTGGGAPSDSVSFMPGATDCRAGSVPQIFSDVPPSSPFYEAIQWMAQEGITQGFPDGTFRPQLDVTREGVASWLYEFAGAPSVSGPQEFVDVPPSSPFYEAIQWMAQEGITQGFPDGTFRPRLDITREGVAAWLHQYDQTLP